MATKRCIHPVADLVIHNRPAPYNQEGRFLKIIPDNSFWQKIVKRGLPTFEREATELVGHSLLASSWCMDDTVIRRPEGVAHLPRVALTCIDQEACVTDIECISKLVGKVNSENLIFATQLNLQIFNRVARLPVMTYTSDDVLVICPPSQAQLDFAEKPRAVRQVEILKEAFGVYKKVKRVKQLKRKK